MRVFAVPLPAHEAHSLPRTTGRQQWSGVGAHKDPGYLTLVMQDDHSGLEVETADGWIPAPLPGALVVNIGELLELASDGYLKATLHRVVSPPPGYRASPAPSSWRQGWMRLCHCLASPRAGGAGRRAPERSRQPALLSGGENVLKGRLRSHPDVAARHYAGEPQREPALV